MLSRIIKEQAKLEDQLAELIARDGALEAKRNAATAQLEQLLQQSAAAAPPAQGQLWRWLAARLVAPLLAPLREQQQASGAATLQLIYRLNELADARRSLTYALITMLRQNSAALAERAGRLEAHNRMLYTQIQLINDQLAGLEDADAQLLAALAHVPPIPPASPAVERKAAE